MRPLFYPHPEVLRAAEPRRARHHTARSAYASRLLPKQKHFGMITEFGVWLRQSNDRRSRAMKNEEKIRERLALLLEVSCEQFELARAFANREFDVSAPMGTSKTHLFRRANSTATMALAKEFLFNSRRALRLVEDGKGKLALDRPQRIAFINTLKPIIDIRNVNEHGFDEKSHSGKPIIRPKLHKHHDGFIAVDETSMVVDNGKILIGPLDLESVYNSIFKLKEIAGFSSLPRHDELTPNAD